MRLNLITRPTSHRLSQALERDPRTADTEVNRWLMVGSHWGVPSMLMLTPDLPLGGFPAEVAIRPFADYRMRSTNLHISLMPVKSGQHPYLLTVTSAYLPNNGRIAAMTSFCPASRTGAERGAVRPCASLHVS